MWHRIRPQAGRYSSRVLPVLRAGDIWRGVALSLWLNQSRRSLDTTYRAIGSTLHFWLDKDLPTPDFPGMERKLKGTPPRLPVIFQRFDAPLYFVTFNTLLKRQLLANESVHAAFRGYAERGLKFNVATGRYVLMPDHVHVFVRIGHDMTLRRWESGLKQCLGKAISALGHKPTTLPGMKLKSFWQPGFFDHLLRRDESYAQKWDYVWRNPVRAKLVMKPEDWPYQGEIHVIDRA